LLSELAYEHRNGLGEAKNAEMGSYETPSVIIELLSRGDLVRRVQGLRAHAHRVEMLLLPS